VEARATDGNHEAIEALYRAHGDRIWRAVVAYAQDPEIASDAVAEAFAQAIVRGDGVRSPAGWVWRTAFRIAAGMLKERSRSTPLLGTESYELPAGTRDLVASLARLPAKQRAALVLFYYADYPISQIADILRSNALAVRVDLSRGRKRLGRILEVDHA
jgi:RNA polymerase sigma-70 factor (ECF subfamily)